MGMVIDAVERFNARRLAADKKRGKPSGDGKAGGMDRPMSEAELRTQRLKDALKNMKRGPSDDTPV